MNQVVYQKEWVKWHQQKGGGGDFKQALDVGVVRSGELGMEESQLKLTLYFGKESLIRTQPSSFVSFACLLAMAAFARQWQN